MTGAVIPAQQAADLGLISELVDDGTALERAMALAAELNGLDRFAVRTTKVTLNRYLVQASESVLRLGLAYEEMAMGRPAFQEMMRAAIERQRGRDEAKQA
jgi:enoyl-CoA hydratase